MPPTLENQWTKTPSFYSHNTHFGDYGENTVKCILEHSGYIVEKTAKLRFQGDLRTICPQTGEIHRIEVKSAQQTGKRYRFCLYKRNHTSHLNSEFVFLVAIDRYGNEFYYCIPRHEILSVTYITIPTHPLAYQGRYAKYRVYDQVNLDDLKGQTAW